MTGGTVIKKNNKLNYSTTGLSNFSVLRSSVLFTVKINNNRHHPYEGARRSYVTFLHLKLNNKSSKSFLNNLSAWLLSIKTKLVKFF